MNIDTGEDSGTVTMVDASGAANTNVVVASSFVTGLAPATIIYRSTGGVLRLGLDGSDNADTIFIRSTAADTTRS